MKVWTKKRDETNDAERGQIPNGTIGDGMSAALTLPQAQDRGVFLNLAPYFIGHPALNKHIQWVLFAPYMYSMSLWTLMYPLLLVDTYSMS